MSEWREVGGRGWTYFRIHDRGLDASYMEANGNQNVDLNSQLGTIVATHPHLQLKQNSIPSPPPSLNFVVHPCLSFARFCESRISSYSNNCHYAHKWSRSSQYLSSVHKRYPAIYVDDHIWKCTTGLVRAAILKSEGVLAVFSTNLKTLWKKFSKIGCSEKVDEYLLQL